jgi:4-hydroxy-tetrahydrodipicolinate synthase
LQNRITFANEVLVRRFNQLSAIKEAMRLKGMQGGYPRKPALPLTAEEKNSVEALLKEIDEAPNARAHQNR